MLPGARHNLYFEREDLELPLERLLDERLLDERLPDERLLVLPLERLLDERLPDERLLEPLLEPLADEALLERPEVDPPERLSVTDVAGRASAVLFRTNRPEMADL